MIQKNLEITDEVIDQVLNEGIQCCAEVEVGEIVDCLITMFKHIQDSDMVQHIKQICGPDKNNDIDQFIICMFVSEVATITANFKNREENGAEA